MNKDIEKKIEAMDKEIEENEDAKKEIQEQFS